VLEKDHIRQLLRDEPLDSLGASWDEPIFADFNKARTTHGRSWSVHDVHRTLKVTPEMAAGVTDRLWEKSRIWSRCFEAWEAAQ
jgi:hypothetical protein